MRMEKRRLQIEIDILIKENVEYKTSKYKVIE
jgi:hypothetical protein